MGGKFWAGLCVSLAILGVTEGAQAGVEECGNLRLEDAGSCEIRGDIQCEGGCSELGVYKKACATELRTVCKEECVLDPEPTCTDSCTEGCSADCDRGVNVICIHNCFGECTGSCTADCESAKDPEQCVATCEANCDGECDIKCKPLVDGSCYKHCIECCGGACTAQANMTCQQSCQEEKFETCEYELRADCQASCSGDGALFCDGEYALSGTAMPACGAALLAQGIDVLDTEVKGAIEGAFDDVDKRANASVSGCSLSSGTGAGGPVPRGLVWGAALFGVFGLVGSLRRRGR